MSLPASYDAWRLRGPEEHTSVIMEACADCGGIGRKHDAAGEYDCPECEGIGEIETQLDEPDGDYEYERRRDAQMEDAE